MNRRKFIWNASLATAGGVIASGLPAWASVVSGADRRVVLAVVAGISRENFIHLFPKTLPNALGNAGHLMTDMRYNGQAAGHRLALESLLQGRYLRENENGKKPLIETTLFTASGNGSKKFLLTADRQFLKEGSYSVIDNPLHLCIKADIRSEAEKNDSDNLLPLPSINNPNPLSSVNENRLIPRLAKPQDTSSDDSFLAQLACMLLEKEQPQLMVVHFMGADAAHADVSLARKNHEHISLGLQQMWDTISNHPQMKDALFIVIPDFGRNGTPNSIKNAEGKLGTDHSIADENTKNIACLFASPKGFPKKITASGESIDILPTLLHFLGTKTSPELPGKSLL